MSSSQSIRSHQRLPVKNAAAIVRDVCEMSISLDASQSKWDMGEMSLSRSHNPFTSSGTFTGSVSGAGGFGMNMAASHGGHGGRGMMGPPSHLPTYHTNMNSSHSYSSAGSHHSGGGYGHGIQHHPTASQHNINNRKPLSQQVRKIPTQDEYEEDFEQVDPYEHDQDFKNQYDEPRGGGNYRRQEEKKTSGSSFVNKYPRK